MKFASTLFVSLILTFGAMAINSSLPQNSAAGITQSGPVQTKNIQEEEADFPPVDDMHHFMEYISKPSYRELKSMFGEEKIRRSTWRKISQHALVLAESTILVADRPPADSNEEVAADWRALSKANYDHAVALYKASREKEEERARESYSLMLDACNKCHEKYDENNHQLAK